MMNAAKKVESVSFPSNVSGVRPAIREKESVQLSSDTDSPPELMIRGIVFAVIPAMLMWVAIITIFN